MDLYFPSCGFDDVLQLMRPAVIQELVQQLGSTGLLQIQVGPSTGHPLGCGWGLWPLVSAVLTSEPRLFACSSVPQICKLCGMHIVIV